jgi:SAM-dependent methyltransferase
MRRRPVVLRSACGRSIPLPVERWRDEATATERALLAACPGPLLDVGCGPGRVVLAAASGGRAALGIDSSPAAVAEARDRGAPVLQRNVFDPIPAEGRWGSVLLWDGNVGIGGDPVRLLRRARHLLAGGGAVVCEVEPPGSPSEVLDVCVCPGGDEATGPWFPWARLSADDVAAVAAAGGLVVDAVQYRSGRWFAWLRKPTGPVR